MAVPPLPLHRHAFQRQTYYFSGFPKSNWISRHSYTGHWAANPETDALHAILFNPGQDSSSMVPNPSLSSHRALKAPAFNKQQGGECSRASEKLTPDDSKHVFLPGCLFRNYKHCCAALKCCYRLKSSKVLIAAAFIFLPIQQRWCWDFFKEQFQH